MTSKRFLTFFTGVAFGSTISILITKILPDGKILDHLRTLKDSENSAPTSLGSPQKHASESRDNELSCYLSPDNSDKTPVFSIGQKRWTFSDIPLKDQARLARLSDEGSLKQAQLIEELAIRVSSADSTAKTIPELKELTDDIAQIDDSEVKAFYQSNRDSFGKNMTMDKIKPTVTSHLKSQKISRWLEEKKAELRQNGVYSKSFPFLCPPALNFHREKNITSHSEKTPPLNIIVVTHPLCSACRGIWPQLNFLQKRKSHILQLQALPFVANQSSPIDQILAKSQFCASREGSTRLESWLEVVHRAPLEFRSNEEALTGWIKGRASTEAQLNTKDFAACLDSQEAQKFADTARQFNSDLGINKAPVAYVNGRRILSYDENETGVRETIEKLIHSYESL